MEIAPTSFYGLQVRLLELLRNRINNGDITERGLARLTGISQPHIHNVLKGARSLSPELTDVLLAHFRLTALDLFSREELTDHLARTNPHRPSRLQPVPVLEGLLGRNQPLPRKGPQRDVHTVPLHLAETATDPLVASLAADPEMESVFAAEDLVLLDQSEAARTAFQREGYYVVRTAEGPIVRALLHGGDRLYLITERNRQNPAQWEQVSLIGRDLLDIVLARVIWLNRRRRWEDHVA